MPPSRLHSGDGNAYGVGSIFFTGRLDTGEVRAVACGDNAPAEQGLSTCVVLSP